MCMCWKKSFGCTICTLCYVLFLGVCRAWNKEDLAGYIQREAKEKCWSGHNPKFLQEGIYFNMLIDFKVIEIHEGIEYDGIVFCLLSNPGWLVLFGSFILFSVSETRRRFN